MQTRSTPDARFIARCVLAALYLAAGALHLMVPGPFLGIMPVWVPLPSSVIHLTGLAEIAGAVGLMIPRFRRAAGIGLALYAVCVYPANIQHAINDLTTGTGLPLAYHLIRLPLQPLIVWWALWVGNVIDWPFRKRG